MSEGRWVIINEEECPGCQRRGDAGERKGGLCWRCNLPAQLDPEEHGHLMRTLLIERDSLLDTKQAVDGRMSDRAFEETYGASRAYVRPILQRMLERNQDDTDRLETDEREAA